MDYTLYYIIYSVMDTVSLGAVMMDFDYKIFESTRYHKLNVVFIFKFTSKYNTIPCGVSTRYAQSYEHYDLIEKNAKRRNGR